MQIQYPIALRLTVIT